MDIAPTPEFMEIVGRIEAKGGDFTNPDQYQRECELMRKNRDSV
jgi:hypothetical protein